jgi:hypothetical protein
LIGFDLVQDLAVTQSPLIRMLAALAIGLLAAGLAVGFQWLAFGLVGFLAGHFLVQTALAHFEVTQNATIWILAGGVIGGVLGLWLVDWAVIFLSSLAGATMIASEVNAEARIRVLILVALTTVGVVFQRTRLRQSQRPR